MKVSSGLRKLMLDTGSFKATMDGCILKFYAGPEPEFADSPIDGTDNTLLCDVYNGNDGSTPLTFGAGALVTPVGNATIITLDKNAAETWAGTNVTSGTATFFRLELPADDQASSISHPRVQGTVSAAGADLNLTGGVTLTAGQTQPVDYFTVTFPTA